MSQPLISICIPTYKRPGLLAEALDSCFAQTYKHYEIVIGDDSPDDETALVVSRYAKKHPNTISYLHHAPSLGQNANVNDLFRRAAGTRLTLLHDDDLLLPAALATLAMCWELLPTVDGAFGKQLLINDDGTPRPAGESETLNLRYKRTAAQEGLQSVPVLAGLSQMFPNDCFLVATKLAREVGYRSSESVGQACDADFGIRFCAAARDLWFVNEYVAKYRLTNQSVSKSFVIDTDHYEMLCSINASGGVREALDIIRRDRAPGAASGFAKLGEPRKALQVFLSADYPLRSRITIRGGYHAVRIMAAFGELWVKRLLNKAAKSS